MCYPPEPEPLLSPFDWFAAVCLAGFVVAALAVTLLLWWL